MPILFSSSLAVIVDVPLISGVPRSGEVLTANTSLTNPTYQWYLDGAEIVGETGSTYTVVMTDMMQTVTVVTSGDEGSATSPGVYIYHNHADPSHNDMDNAALALVPHEQATAIAIASGDWSDVNTWQGGTIPVASDKVLIPAGVTVTLDIASSPRLDWVRIDGHLTVAVDQSTDLLYETMLVTKPGKLSIGTSGAPLPHPFTHTQTISNRDVDTSTVTATNINITRDPTLLGRGLLVQGEIESYGDKRVNRALVSAYPLAGATTLNLQFLHSDWRVGDEIDIPGTGGVRSGSDRNWDSETETRIITALGSNSVSFTGGLLYDHDDQNNNFTLDPTEMPLGIYNRTRNIIIKSEDAGSIAAHQRGHTMFMHDGVKVKINDIRFEELGRTDKSVASGIKVGSDFKFVPRLLFSDGFGHPDVVPVTRAGFFADDNIQSRYPLHLHFPGVDQEEVPEVTDCIVIGSPGWGPVHHGGEGNFVRVDFCEFFGAGFVSETGNEIGIWVDCAGWHSTCQGFVNSAGFKTAEDGCGRYGDFGFSGACYLFRGRAMRTNRNFAYDCPHGHAFWHRDSDESIAEMIDVERQYMDIKDLAPFEGASASQMENKDYPIIHHSDNWAIGCRNGFFVSKNQPEAHSGFNIEIKNFKGYALAFGMTIEYIGQYLISEPEVYAKNNQKQNGIQVGANSIQVVVRNPISRGFRYGVFHSTDTVFAPYSDFNTTDTPMLTIIRGTGSDLSNSSVAEIGYSDATNGPNVTRIITGDPTYLAKPSINIPFIVFDYNGSAVSNTQTGTVTDTLGTMTIPQVWDDLGLDPSDGAPDNYLAANGYWTFGGDNIFVWWHYFSDRTTGRALKQMVAARYTGSTAGLTNNGAFTRSSTGPVRADISGVVVPLNGNSTVDILTAATGEAGATLTLDDSFYAPQNGKLELNGDGTVTYIRDLDRPDADQFTVFVDDGRGRSESVLVEVAAA